MTADLLGDAVPEQPPSRFKEFWDAWPSGNGRKKNRRGCEQKWRSKRLDERAAEILEDVRWRSRYHKPWLDGFVPLPATYLNQEGWNDERVDVRTRTQRADGPRDDDAALTDPLARRAILGLLCRPDPYPDSVILKTFAISRIGLDRLKREVSERMGG